MTELRLPPHRERETFPVLFAGTRMWLAQCECHYITRQRGQQSQAVADLDRHIDELSQHGLNTPR